MSKCMYTAQGDFVCNENKDTTEHFGKTFHQIKMEKNAAARLKKIKDMQNMPTKW